MPNRPWSKDEEEILLSAKDKRRIKVPNRSQKSIRRKLIQMKLVRPAFSVRFHKKRAWTESEVKILKSTPDPRRAKINGRSRQSIVCMAIRLKLIKKRPAKRPWKRKHTKLLQSLIAEGKTPVQISKMGILPYSRNSIQKKMGRLGLSQSITQNKFPKDTIGKFKNFLRENWQGKTPNELVDLWNQHNCFKIKRNKVVYHLTAMKIKVSHEEVLRIKKAKEKEDIIKSQLLTNTTLESLRSIRIELMKKRHEENKDMWTGLPLDENILKEEPINFF